MDTGCCETPGTSDPGGGRPTTVAGPAGRTARSGRRPTPGPPGCHGPTGPSLAVPVALVGVQRVVLALEVLEVHEALVDAGEPDVGDVVEAAKRLHRQGPDSRRRHLG